MIEATEAVRLSHGSEQSRRARVTYDVARHEEHVLALVVLSIELCQSVPRTDLKHQGRPFLQQRVKNLAPMDGRRHLADKALAQLGPAGHRPIRGRADHGDFRVADWDILEPLAEALGGSCHQRCVEGTRHSEDESRVAAEFQVRYDLLNVIPPSGDDCLVRSIDVGHEHIISDRRDRAPDFLEGGMRCSHATIGLGRLGNAPRAMVRCADCVG